MSSSSASSSGGISPGRHDLGQAADPGRVGAVGQDLGELRDEVGEVGGVAALGAAGELEADDVEAALHEAAQERQPGLDLLALGPHRPDLVHACDVGRSPR